MEFGKRKLTSRRAGFMAPPIEDPLAGVEYTGNVEVDAAAELTALQAAYRERAKRERSRYESTTDSEYWIAICFVDRASKDAFLEAAGASMLGDKYIDGHQFAKIVGVTLERG